MADDLDELCLETLATVVDAAIASGEASEVELLTTLEPEQYSQFWAMLSYKQRRQLAALAAGIGWQVSAEGVSRPVEVAA